MLKIINFSKIFSNGNVGAKDINLEIESGDIFAFIGHNGAGKTSTIKCVVGASKITNGDILINGKSITKQPLEAKKLIAYIPDNPSIYEGLTGIQYINLIGDIFGVAAEEREVITNKLAKELYLTDVLNNSIGTYSHGMKQKLVIISALIHKPKLLIMDEPFVGLDPKASFSLKKIMKEFVAQGGAIFFSTHVLEVAEKLCNKVAIIKSGQIIAQGSMDEIKKDKSLENVFLEVNND